MIIEHVLAVLGLITAFGTALTYIIKAYKYAKAPNVKQDEQIKELTKRLDKHDQLLGNDKQRLDQMEKGVAVEMRALLAMVNHMIDNNHTESLLDVRKELDHYLINR